MGILNAIGDAVENVVDGAKDLVGLGEDDKKETTEAAVGAELEGAVFVDPVEMAQITEAAPVETVQTYTVQSGDTLSKIAKEHYGNSNEYMKIFEANRDNLSDPDVIKVGQELVIPE